LFGEIHDGVTGRVAASQELDLHLAVAEVNGEIVFEGERRALELNFLYFFHGRRPLGESILDLFFVIFSERLTIGTLPCVLPLLKTDNSLFLPHRRARPK